MHLLEQIYNRGADMWVGVFTNLISAAILGLLGYFFWETLLPPELLKTLRIDRTRRLDEEWDRYDHRAETLAGYVRRADDATEFGHIRQVWLEYVDWLAHQTLVGANSDSVNLRGHLDLATQGGNPANFPGVKGQVLQVLNGTVIPTPHKPRPEA